MPGFNLTKHMMARIVGLYCLGNKPLKIGVIFSERGLKVSRSTIHRVIASVDDPELQRLHELNWRRGRRAYKRGKPRPFWYGAGLPADSGELGERLARAPQVFRKIENWATTFYVARTVVAILPVYGDPTARQTFIWLNHYLTGLSHTAGMLVFFRQDDLERFFFGPADELVGIYWPMEYVKTPTELKKDLIHQLGSEPIKAAAREAIRIVQYEQLHPPRQSGVRPVVWKNRISYLETRDSPAPIELYDDA
jgi:hypothetical protein